MKYSQLRLEIVEYYDSVISEVDLVVETQVARDATLEMVLYERREKQIAHIQQLSRAGLARADSCVDTVTNQVLLTLKELLDEFCFVVEFAGLPFLIKTNRYVERSEIEHFKKIMKWDTLTHQERLDELTGQRIFLDPDGSLRYIKTEGLESVMFEEVQKQFQDADNLFLELSSWFAQGQEIDGVIFYATQNIEESAVIETIKSPFKIKTIELLSPERGDDDENEAFKQFLEACCSIFESTQKFVIHSGIEDNFEKLQQFTSIDPRIELRVIGKLTLDELTVDKRNKIYSLECSPDVLNHHAPLHGFGNLRELTLEKVEDAFDWSLLDPLRTSLKTLNVNELTSLSWTMFSGMESLEKLYISFANLSKVELDEKSQLFADLINLERLSLPLNKCLLTSGCQIELPMVNQLNVRFIESQDINQLDADQISLVFKLPELSSLDISNSKAVRSTVLSRMLDSFSSAAVNSLSLDDASEEGITIAVRLLTKLRKLILDHLGPDVKLDMLAGMENLRHLEINSEHDIPVEVLHHLTSLRVLRLPCDCAIKQREILSCLPSIKRVYFIKRYSDFCEKFVLSVSNKLVYQRSKASDESGAEER